MRHSKVESRSDEVNVKRAVVEIVGPSAPVRIDVVGGVRSTVNVCEGLNDVPAEPACSAWTTYVPSGSSSGAVFDQEPSPAGVAISVCTSWSGEPKTGRMTFTITEPASPLAIPAHPLNVGVGSFVKLPSAGLASVTAGSAGFTVQVRVTESGSRLPAASMARTSKTCTAAARPE